MGAFEIVLLLAGGIIVGVIFLLRWAIISQGFSKRIVNTISSIFIFFWIGYLVNYYVKDIRSRTHYVDFKIAESIMVKIKVFELDSFLDSPYNFKISICEVNSGCKHFIEMNTVDGPLLDFSIDSLDNRVLRISGPNEIITEDHELILCSSVEKYQKHYSLTWNLEVKEW